MMTFFTILVLAAVVLVALIRKNSVKFHLHLWGARVHLEARGPSSGSTAIRRKLPEGP
jgi:hypothetical protein